MYIGGSASALRAVAIGDRMRPRRCRAMSLAETLAVLLLSLAAILALRGLATRRAWGLGPPGARLVAEDLSGARAPEGLLRSRRHRLQGRPDLLLERGGRLIPVELKPSRRAAGPRAADRLQVAAYCFLVEETEGRAPPFGLLRYAEGCWELPYGKAERAWVLATLAAMDEAEARGGAARSHQQAARCRACALAEACDEVLED